MTCRWLFCVGVAAIAAGEVAAASDIARPEMAVVPAGPFTMGRDDGVDDERPAHRVELTAFEIDRLPGYQ